MIQFFHPFLSTVALIAFSSLSLSGLGAAQTVPPSPYGSLPSVRQIEHSQMETYAFLHFTVNTFTNREWGNGDESETVFNPTDFDPDQIVLALKAAGMKGAILTAKHHDGFCLWPTATTTHNISKSLWEGGHGDVVRALAEACKRHGLKFGVYLSPWDRNNAAYGRPEYVDIYRRQLQELVTSYGPIFEIWHDGANGGTGYYGGANEDRSIDRRTYYDWPTTWQLIRNAQPDACIFSDVGPDLRWVGNEDGQAAKTSWQTFDPVGKDHDQAAPGYVKDGMAPEGTKHGVQWLPAECDVSIRPGWFWHEAENGSVKSPAQLFDLYCESVGRGASFLLNVPPDRKGQLDDPDVKSLEGFGMLMKDTFRTNFAEHASVVATNIRGGDRVYGPQNLLSTDLHRYWATDDFVDTPTVTIDLGSPKTFDLIRVREPIQLGQRVESFSVDAYSGGNWNEIGSATSIGSCRIIRLAKPVTAEKVRLRITHSPACVLLYGFGLYRYADPPK
jgi:alpha-L-fucosidase